MNNILFRADASSTIGTGHIMRDLVLAQQYPNSEIIFATQELEGNLNYKIIESGYEVITLESNSMAELDKLIKKYDIDMIVIDHYGIDYNYEKALKEENPSLIILSFDDTYEKHYCDILLNHNIYADDSKYLKLVPKSCELHCGEKYTLLRDEFMEVKKSILKSTKSKKNRIFIAIGGADTINLNPKIIQLLEKNDNIIVEIVTSTANKHIEELKNLIKNKKWINLHINSVKIAELMRKSDFAIITPSVTLNEVWYMKLPFIAIQTANNQKYMVEYIKRLDLPILKEWRMEKFEIILKEYINGNFINY